MPEHPVAGRGLTASPRRDDATARFVRVLRHLVRTGDTKGIVRLVERWSEEGQPTTEGRLAEVRALVSLKLMDRAWARLREVTDVSPDDVEGLVLSAELFVARGWPGRARGAIERLAALAPTRPEVAALRVRADAGPVEPPGDAREIERSGTPAQVLGLAEHYLAEGSFLRARTLLERLRREDPGNRKVDLYLWALRGEFVDASQPVDALLDDLWPASGPARAMTISLTDASGIDLADSDGVPMDFLAPEPPTQEVDKNALVEGTATRPNAPFPDLFRRPDEPPVPPKRVPRPGGKDDEEVTHHSHLAGQLDVEAVLGEPTDGPSDTRIQQVLQRPGSGSSGSDIVALAPLDGPTHRRKEGEDPLRETLDLDAWRRSLGVEPPSDVEGEDPDRVVHTRREGAAEVEPSSRPVGPMEVIEKVPQPPPAPARPAAETKSAVGRPASPSGKRHGQRDEHGPQQGQEDDWRGGSARGGGVPPSQEGTAPQAAIAGGVVRVLVASVAVAFLVVVGGAVLIGGMRHLAGQGVLSDLEVALAEGDTTGLVALATRLDAQVRSEKPPLGPRAAALALAEAVLWSEYTGSPVNLENAEGALAVAEESGGPEHEIALARATLALGRGDLAEARAQLDDAGAGDGEVSYLARRIAVAAAREDDLAHLASRGSIPSGARHASAVPAALRAAGADERSVEAAMAALVAHPEDPSVILASHEEAWEDLAPADRLAALDAWAGSRPVVLAARHEGRLHARRAWLLTELGRWDQARTAAARARAADPRGKRTLYAAAGVAVGDGAPLQALDPLERCLAEYPSDPDCRRGLVEALILASQAPEAAERIAGWTPEDDDRPLAMLDAWVEVERARTEPDLSSGALPERPDLPDRVRKVAEELPQAPGNMGALGRYVLAVAEAASSDLDAAASLERSARELGASPDPMDRVLVARALALRSAIAPH